MGRLLRLFKDLFEEVILVTNSPLDYLNHEGPIVTDIFKGKGAVRKSHLYRTPKMITKRF